MVLSPRKIVSWLCITWSDDGRPSVGLLVAPFLPVSRTFFWLLAIFLVIKILADMLFCSKNNCRNASIMGKNLYNDIHTSKEREEKRNRKKMQDPVHALALSAQGTILSIINQRIIFYDY